MHARKHSLLLLFLIITDGNENFLRITFGLGYIFTLRAQFLIGVEGFRHCSNI
jgi:hypothetical protein